MGPEAMSRRIAVSMVVSVVVSVALVSMTTGCTRVETSGTTGTQDSVTSAGQDTTRPNVDTGYAVISRPGSDEARGALAGALPRPIESYASDAAGFHALVRSRGWVGRDRPRKCIDDPACARPGNPARAWLRVQAIEDAHEVDLNGLPGNGVLMGRIMNVGRMRDSIYGIAPGREEWYIVLEPMEGRPDSARQKIARLTFEGNSDVPRAVEVVEVAEPVVACPPHGEPRPRFPEADFRPCSLSVSTPDTTSSFLTARAWMACAHGCCTSNPVPR